MNFTNALSSEGCGTFLQGYIDVDYKKLVDVFGEPHESDGYKVDAEWTIRLESGKIATIYNYKTGRNYRGENGLDVEDIRDWHIGGTDPIVVDNIKEILAISY